MHPDLSRHWPTEEYNVFINWLRECHKNYSIWEIFGHYNDPDQERRKCLNSEDTEKKTKSREYNNACKKDVFNPAEESEKQITAPLLKIIVQLKHESKRESSKGVPVLTLQLLHGCSDSISLKNVWGLGFRKMAA
uniref:COX assembly mitochondrial protein 2 homolog n=1 Tax=Panthera onca TaxID=9690 RepID=UPI002955BDB4|nr:COX assembly mitochondrial protein 2 homolog [Panthera onca]